MATGKQGAFELLKEFFQKHQIIHQRCNTSKVDKLYLPVPFLGLYVVFGPKSSTKKSMHGFLLQKKTKRLKGPDVIYLCSIFYITKNTYYL